MKLKTLKTILPRTDKPRHEPDVQIASLNPKRKPQAIRDFEERSK